MVRKCHLVQFVLFFFSVALLACAHQAVAQDASKKPDIKEIVVFGDSNVDGGLADPGSLYDRSGGVFPKKPNVFGRYTNGPMAAEYLASMLSARLRNYGVSAATTGNDNLLDHLLKEGVLTDTKQTGVLRQIEEYRRDLAGATPDPKALFIYWAGSNDIFKATAVDVDQRIAGAAQNIEKGLTQLVELGAKHIFVVNRTARPEIDSQDNQFGIRLNEAMASTVKATAEKLSSDIELFDVYSITADMKKNPAKYGFTKISEQCKENPACLTSQEVADTYVQWDGAHVTTKAHKIIAEAMLRQLEK